MLSFGLRRKESAPAGEYLTARLNARLQPIDRGEHFEDALHDTLQEGGLGEVTGGGTQLADEPAGIEFCDLEIHVGAADEETIRSIMERLEALGAPKGSKLILDSDGREIEFGANEGLAIYLNGVDLPDSVYAECDVNHVIEQMNAMMDDRGKFMSHWQGSKETGLYFYGPSFDEMKAAIADFVAEYPLCRQSRIEQIA